MARARRLLFNVVSGLYAPDAGSVRLTIAHPWRSAHEICQHGIARSFRSPILFRGLSIRENLRLSLQARHRFALHCFGANIDAYPDVHAETAELVRFLGLEASSDRGRDLSMAGPTRCRSRH